MNLFIKHFFLLVFLPKIIFSQTIVEKEHLSFCKTISMPIRGEIKKSDSHSGCISKSGGHTFTGQGQIGKFKIIGEPYSLVEVIFSDGDFTGSGRSIIFETGVPLRVSLDGKGEHNFSIGASAVINANQKPGMYSGSYSVGYKYSKLKQQWKYHTGYAEIEITPTPMTIYEQAPMFFSDVVNGNSGGTIKLNHNGILENVSGNAKFVGGSGSPAIFSLTGSSNTEVHISFTEGKLRGTGSTIRLHSLSHNLGQSPVISQNGTLNIKVGGQLKLNPNQKSGMYSGRYSINVDY
ncbi:MAG: DUF4402 domain-containing protein [Alphaproteobacteria bacterium]|nr:MAG: hypothetical protein B6I23_02855 [Rickettsiaceae bacterium 4572_127]